MATFPSYLSSTHDDADQLKDWTVSRLGESYMNFQLHKSIQIHTDCSSLTFMTIGKILDALLSSENVVADTRTIAESLNSTLLKQLLNDPRMPYQVLRLFCALPQTKTSNNRELVEIDDLMLQNERYIRSMEEKDRKDQYLVKIEDLTSVLTVRGGSKLKDPILGFIRTQTPKGCLEMLDNLRDDKLRILANSTAFAQTFDRITNGILRGLDWSNVMVAGGMALVTLMHTNPKKDHERKVRDPDINLYIYGLSPEEANQKCAAIFETWASNLPESASGRKLVVKSAKSINFLSTYPNRRIKIVLELLSTPIDVLLKFDIDACAIGFNGNHAFMLPRCARAIETGYSIFTMELLWGHHLGSRRATHKQRIFDYAERGFGIRILPSYARSLEEDNLELKVFKQQKSRFVTAGCQQDSTSRGCAPGLNTLKWIAYLGADHLHQILLSKRLPNRRSLGTDPNMTAEQRRKRFQSARDEYRKIREANKTCRRISDLRRLNDDVSWRTVHPGSYSWSGLGSLEMFLTCCEAWRLKYCGDIRLDPYMERCLFNEPDFHDIPMYDWNDKFDIDRFAEIIETQSTRLWGLVRQAICRKLGIQPRDTSLSNYSTRRLRRHVCGPDFASVQEKQITIPLVIPRALEEYLLTTLPDQYWDLPDHFVKFRSLIAVHNPAKYRQGVVPSLQDAADESGNLRYWVITNQSMWSHQHPVMDEFAELMWDLFLWFKNQDPTQTENDTCVHSLAQSFKRRTVLPEVPDDIPQDELLTMKPGLPSLREALLFRHWAFRNPNAQHLSYEYDGWEPKPSPPDDYEQSDFVYPYPGGSYGSEENADENTDEDVGK